MKQTMEKCFEYDTDLHMLFIDFLQAFDSVRRRELLNFVEGFGVPRKIVRLAVLTIKDSGNKALVGGKISRASEMSTGVLSETGMDHIKQF